MAARLDIQPMLPSVYRSRREAASRVLVYVIGWQNSGDPRKPPPTMDRLEASYAALESILIERSRGAGLSTGHELDPLDLSSFKIQSVNQTLRLARLRAERTKLHRSNTVVHKDLAFWIEEMEDLIRQLNRNTHSNSKVSLNGGSDTRRGFLFLAV